MMSKKLLVLLAMMLSLLGYTFAATSAATGSSSDTSSVDDAELESLLKEDMDVTADSGAATSTQDAWGYADTDMITVMSAETSATIKSSVIKDASGKSILSYRVKYSTKSFADQIDSASADFAAQEKSFSFALSGDMLVPVGSTGTDYLGTNDSISMVLDGLKTGTKYYVLVYPINADNVEGKTSKETSFVTLGQPGAMMSGDHSAAGSMSTLVAEYTGGKINLSWPVIDGAKEVQVMVKGPKDTDYKLMEKLPGTATTYSFAARDNGMYLAKLVSVDAAGNQKEMGPTSVKPEAKIADKMTPTGPATTFMVMLLALAAIFYATYRFRRAK